MSDLGELVERAGLRTALVTFFILGWVVFAASNWNLVRRGRIDVRDRWAGLRYGWAWPVVVIGFMVLYFRDLWKARK